ncbi:hypothetical protein FO440_21925 [Mucilaginibacter corticis]|uniref:Carboxypeptidase regulatory-like domain-containing protein n=1 Tax=Mucilaginibacter corticis TaxID=2597670 RepID=A0A556M9B6_9SPHI|nr:hypothetical protein [Mucilaginibacter corticis]TSJ36493.1 hypothetical protein FO440_21925 [Mucilaginibacter corticis]
MKKLLHFACLLLLTFAGCKKDSQTQTPEPAKGSISGMLQVPGSMSSITASATINGQPVNYTTKADASGSFKFSGLPAGVYSIDFVPGGALIASSVTATIYAGQNIDLGTIYTYVGSGKITGTFSPAGLTTGIFISYTTSDGTVRSMLSNALTTSGTIQANLPPGTYTITFSDVWGYITPPAQTIKVSNGQTTDLGAIVFEKAKTGSISGTVIPANASSSITIARLGAILTALGPVQTFTINADAAGHFRLGDLDGAYYYDISVNPAAGSSLNAPVKIRIFLPSGQDMDLGNLELTSSPALPQLSYFRDNQTVSIPLVTADLVSRQLTIAQPRDIHGAYFGLTLNNVTAPGDYICNGTTGSSITLATDSHSDYPLNWESNSAGGSGLIKVTAFDPVHQTISGTFTATLAFGGNITNITSGAFVNVHYSKR